MTVHLQLAEAGKRQALAGNHQAALDRYRAALRLALRQTAAEPFLAHYTDCILDCLEAAGEYAQALEISDRALTEQQTDGLPLREAVRASLLQRRILLLFTLGRIHEGDAALANAEHLGGPVLSAVRDARRRRLTIDARWIDNLKRTHLPSSVTEDRLRHADAHHGEELFQKEYAHG